MSYDERTQAFIALEDSGGGPGCEGASGAHDDVRIAYTRDDGTPPFLRSHTVFVVSGDDYVRQCVGGALSAEGVSFTVLGSAAEYLAGAKASVPACIILDVVLPDMSGFDLQRQLAGTCPPIIFATRRAEIASSVRAMKAGAFDFLTAPFAPQVLLRSVHAALELDRLSSPEREAVIGIRERFERLTPRERQVMRLIVDGVPNKLVAWELGISEITAQIHRGRVKQKMEVASLAELVHVAIRLGMAPAEKSRPPVASQNERRTPTLKYRPTRSYGTPVKKLDSILV